MKKYLVCKTIIFIHILIFIIVGQSYADNNRTYIVGVENIKYLPHYTTENSEYGGFAREFFDLFAQYAGVKFKYRPLPVNRLFIELVEKKIDFKYPDNPRWQIKIKKGKSVVYSNAVEEYLAGGVVLPERKGLGVEKVKALGAVLGFTPLPFMEYIKAGKMTIHTNQNFKSLLEQAILGRVDAVYLDINVASYQLREIIKKPHALVFDPKLPFSKSFYTLSTIKHPELIKVLNRFLKVEKNRIRELKIRYFGSIDLSKY